MTIDEAISIMNAIVHMLEPQYDTDRIEEAVEMAIKALEQQPTDAVDRVTIKEYLDSYNGVKTELSGDAVDRRAVYEILNDAYFLKLDDGAALQESVRQLPSVTPQQKMGRWKRINKEKYVQHAMSYYRCSECGKEIIGTHNYCPNCGRKMQEVEE